MAFKIKFTGVTIKQGEYEMSFVPGEIPGHLRTEEVDESRFTQIQMNLYYADSFAILTPEEALALAGKYYRTMESLWNDLEDNHSQSVLQLIETALSGVDFVIARRYEWESGMS